MIYGQRWGCGDSDGGGHDTKSVGMFPCKVLAQIFMLVKEVFLTGRAPRWQNKADMWSRVGWHWLALLSSPPLLWKLNDNTVVPRFALHIALNLLATSSTCLHVAKYLQRSTVAIQIETVLKVLFTLILH